MKTLPSLLLLLLGAFAQAQISPEAIMELSTPDFANGGPIPARFTCDGVNHSPGLRIRGIPKAAKSLVLLMDDPDAPGGTFNHWLVWGLSPDLKEISTNSVPNGAVQGLNDFKKNGYGGPCPPSGEHRYYFRLYAVDIPVTLPPSARRADLDKLLRGHILKDATLMGRYARPGSRRD
jgi:Raf kinase inhibitor-like YbhB/YbcL family protein